jgi:hypothetical protein
MFTGSAKELTDLARRFTEPANATHRQYEALRAYFVGGLSGRGGTPLRLHPGQLPRPGPPVPPGPGPPLLHPTGQGTAGRAQGRSRP